MGVHVKFSQRFILPNKYDSDVWIYISGSKLETFATNLRPASTPNTMFFIMSN
jgi:hypothetical protein